MVRREGGWGLVIIEEGFEGWRIGIAFGNNNVF